MLGGAETAFVDAAGTVAHADCALEWIVGAEDRWHAPAGSSPRRQRLVDNMPVLATAQRVPGGDVEHRAYATTVDGRVTVVVEIENLTPTPVAAGFVLTSRGAASRDGALVLVDGEPALRFVQPPRSEFVGAPHSLFVVPLAHGATARVTLALDGAPPDPARAADATATARGWTSVAARGARFVLPDATRADDLAQARAFLHLHASRLRSEGKRADRVEAAAVADALTLLGHDDEAGALRLACRLRPTRRGLPLVVPLEVPHVADASRVSAVGAAVVVRDTYRRAIADDGAALDLAPGFELRPNRAPLEIHGLPVGDGIVGFALRWHDDRPAVLWDLDTKARRRLSVRSLDPDWETTESKGEALLGPFRAARS